MMMGLLVRNYIYLVGQVLSLPDDDDGVVGEELYIPGGPCSATS